MSSDKKKNTGLFVAVWFLLLLLLLIVFFVKKDTITGNLQKTDFFGKVFGTTPEFVKNHKDTKPSAQEKEETFSFDLLESGKTAEQARKNTYEEATGTESIKAVKENADVILPEDADAAEENAFYAENALAEVMKPAEKEAESGKKDAVAAEKPKESIKTPAAVQTREVSLYFVVINSDGTVSRKAVKRTLPKSDSPLTDAVNALLSGPLPDERSKNCMSLIPEGTRLLGASVKNGVATLNFSEEFEFNPVGVEGYIAQLTQLVFTATEFSTVKSVQFLIEGEKKDYLGSEGQWIGSPLARSSF